MTNEQFNIIVGLLKGINEKLEYIDSNTSDSASHTSDIKAEVTEIKKTMED